MTSNPNLFITSPLIKQINARLFESFTLHIFKQNSSCYFLLHIASQSHGSAMFPRIINFHSLHSINQYIIFTSYYASY
jgi:hypothetical protein